jgi:hypothetical protein
LDNLRRIIPVSSEIYWLDSLVRNPERIDFQSYRIFSNKTYCIGPFGEKLIETGINVFTSLGEGAILTNLPTENAERKFSVRYKLYSTQSISCVQVLICNITPEIIIIEAGQPIAKILAIHIGLSSETPGFGI